MTSLRQSGLAGLEAVVTSDGRSALGTPSGTEDPGPILPVSLLLVLVPPACPHTALLYFPQISPQIYQSLYFNELAPTHQPDFMIHKVLDQQGQLIRLVTHDILKDVHPARETATMPTAVYSPSSVFSSVASGSVLPASRVTSPGFQSSPSMQRP